MEDEVVALPVEHFEHVGQSLPELTTELLCAHTTQSSEMLGKEDLLQKLEAEVECLQQQLQVLHKDVCSTVRAICLKEDLLAELGEDCEQLEQEVVAVVQDKEVMAVRVKKVMEEKAVQEKLEDSYEEKMATHRMKTQELEQLSCTQIELEALRGKIHSLKGKSGLHLHYSVKIELMCTVIVSGGAYHHEFEGLEQVLNGEKQHCLQDQLAAVEASREALSQDNLLLEEQVSQFHINTFQPCQLTSCSMTLV